MFVLTGAAGCGHPERASEAPPGRAGDAQVTGVSDGDTIALSGVGKTRLIGVDTPEVYGGLECYGREASAFTKRVLRPGRRVRYRLGVEPRDRYGRALAYVWLPGGPMFNELLTERGYAAPLTIPPNVEFAERFVAAARSARAAERGLWAPRTCAGGGGSAEPGGRAQSGDRDCSDFSTRAEAQSYFERKGGRPGHDVDSLDADGNGQVCESLP